MYWAPVLGQPVKPQIGRVGRARNASVDVDCIGGIEVKASAVAVNYANVAQRLKIVPGSAWHAPHHIRSLLRGQ
jgi:hypothetical protein